MTKEHPLKGRKLSEEHKRKIGLANKGKKRTEEQRKRIGLASKGRTSPNKGKTFSKETRKKMSEAAKRRPRSPRSEETKRKISLANKGRKHTEEAKRKMSIASTGRKQSETQKQKARERWMGDKNPRWKGGQAITEGGYVLVSRPDHPFCGNRGYVKRSRLVMEAHIGRYLSREEMVHHINKITDDDRIENLHLCANGSVHQNFHRHKPRHKKVKSI